MRHPDVDVYALTLARAALIYGGPEELAKKLRVTTRQLEAWMSGTDSTPDAVFLQVVDLVMDETLAGLRPAGKPLSPGRP